MNNKAFRQFAAMLCIFCWMTQSFGQWCWIEGEVFTPTTAGSVASAPSAASNNRPCHGMVVKIMDNDLAYDDDLATTSCDSSGSFGISVNLGVTGADDDVYLMAEFRAELPGGKSVYVVPLTGSADAYGSKDDVMRQAYLWSSALSASYWPDYSGTTLYPGTMYLSRGTTSYGTEPMILRRTVQACKYISDNAGAYNIPDDIVFKAEHNQGRPGSNAATICDEDYDQPATTGGGIDALSDINHETGHRVHGMLSSGAPPGPVVIRHWHSTETNRGNAITEGWASYLQCISSSPGDQKSGWLAEAARYWRGEDLDGSDNSGIIVEGAIINTLMAMNDFGEVFTALKDEDPDTFKEWLDRYCINQTTFPPVMAAYDAARANGIAFNRGRITGFQEGVPTSQPAAGNARLISPSGGGTSIQFLRGTVHVTKGALTAAQLFLNAAEVDTPTKFVIGHKAATSNFVGAPDLSQSTTVAAWTWLPEELWANNFTLNTVTASPADGDHDLAIRVKNARGAWDTLLPHFSANGGIAANGGGVYDTDEKWLKNCRTWFNQDTTINTDEKGMVRVDNTAPTASDCKPAAN